MMLMNSLARASYCEKPLMKYLLSPTATVIQDTKFSMPSIVAATNSRVAPPRLIQ